MRYLSLAVCVTLGASTQAQQTPEGGGERWAALPLPSICSEAGADVGVDALWEGRHIVLDPREDAPLRRERRAYRMPVANVIEILEGDAVRRGRNLRFHRPAPPLLARGSRDALDNARVVLDALDVVGDAQEIRLHATLARVYEGEGPSVSASRVPAEFARAPGAQQWSRTVRSGDDLVLGTREETPFLAGFDVQVAAGSEAPDPIFGSVASGETLHLRAWRVGGGAGIFVEGLLDLAHLESTTDFDPGSADLGRIQKPLVRVAQIAFAGEVPNGGALRVALRGAPLEDDAWTLWIEARTETDPQVGWQVLDVALIESETDTPPLPHPGFGIPTGSAFARSRSALEPLTASALWGEVELSLASDRRAGERPRRPLLAYAPGLLVGPDDGDGIWDEARSLARAAESTRTRTAALRVVAGDVEAVLPVASGAVSRVLVGTERAHVTDYRLEIAPESWIAAPVVERTLDGVLVQGRLDGERYACSWWSSASQALPALERGDTGHGAVERVGRSHRSGRLALGMGQAPLPLAESGTVPSLRVQLGAR